MSKGVIVAGFGTIGKTENIEWPDNYYKADLEWNNKKYHPKELLRIQKNELFGRKWW